MKHKSAKITVIIMAAVFLALSSQKIFAQTIAAKEGLGQDWYSVKNDMRFYQIMSEKYGAGYDDYYNLVRERIVQKLKYRYRDYYRDGDVNLFFVLKSNGSLVRIDVDTGRSTADKRLIDIAISSLQGASPFRPFPKELDAAELPFSLTISFKENN